MPVLGSAIGALSGRMDSKFLTAYWLPAFVFALGSFGILAGLVGLQQIDDWIYGLDSVEQTLGVLILVLLISMVAFVLRALTRPITELFAGIALPRAVATWSTRGQLRVKTRGAHLLGTSCDPTAEATAAEAQWLGRRFPVNNADLKPTLFGNVLASAGEHPRLAYAMEGALWWPRLSPLVPGYFQDMLAAAQAPLMALLNLSVVFVALASFAVVVLGLIGAQWVAALGSAIGALLLSRLCYRAAVSQAAEIGSLFRVAFDLYRYDILDQLGLPHPDDLAAERALWRRMTREVVGLPEPTPTDGATPVVQSDPGAPETATPERG